MLKPLEGSCGSFNNCIVLHILVDSRKTGHAKSTVHVSSQNVYNKNTLKKDNQLTTADTGDTLT